MIPIAGKEAFKNYYHGLHMPRWMPLFQFFRGCIWCVVALPLIGTYRGGRWKTGFLTGAAFSIFMAAPLLIPSPIFPDSIRIGHLVEVLSSNFLFGSIVGSVLYVSKTRLVAGS